MKRPIAVLILAILVLGMFGLALKIRPARAPSFFSSVTGEFRMDGDSKWRCYVNTTLTNFLGDVITVRWICINASVTYVDDTSDELGIIENRTLDVALMSNDNYTTSWVVTEFGFDTQPKTLRLESVASTDHGMQYGVSYIEAPLLYEIVAPYGSTPTIDGTIDSHEWNDSASVSFNNTKVFVKQDGINLYIGFNNSDDQFHDEDAIVVAIDVDHDRSQWLQTDDVGLCVYRNGTLIEGYVVGNTWALREVSGWTAVVNSTLDMWQVEFNITYAKINVVARVERTIGVVFVRYRGLEASSPEMFSWPPGMVPSNPTGNPSTWGAITSTGYNWIPEFPSLPILLLSIATLLTVIVKRKRGVRNRKTISGDAT